MENINIKATLGEIVAAYPNTTKVMNKYKLDYCCGGKDTLEKAIAAVSHDMDIVINELEKEMKKTVFTEVIDWKSKSLSELIDFIINKHHTFMKETLEELNTLMLKILTVHYKANGESLLVIHKLFGTLKTELEAHLVKEEKNLFPLIKEYERSKDIDLKKQILQFINDTEDEHDAAGDLFKALEKATNDFVPPLGACYSYKRTFALLDALEKDTFNHIHMENSILFKMI